MKILIASDGHGVTGPLEKLREAAVDCDVVLYGGDFAALGAPDTGKPFLERLAKVHDRIFSVIGNCDEPGFTEDLDSYDMSIQGSLSYFSGLVLSGSGGASKFTGETPNERDDEELADDLALVAESVPEGTEIGAEGWDNLVLVVHNPPANTKLDMITNGAHVGSPLIRSFIERYKPLLAVSGHIHESFAVDALGPTTLVNPGSLAEGRYAVVELSGGGKEPWKVASVSLRTL
jgi:uncharacterized protein